MADQGLRRGNSQTLNRHNSNLSVEGFGAIEPNPRDQMKNGGNKNGLMKMGSNEWSDTQSSKFVSGNQNAILTKQPSFESNENNVNWRPVTDFQPSQERVFIERIEQYSQNIMANHNKICPFTGKCILALWVFILRSRAQ